jgi:hypothetical protein
VELFHQTAGYYPFSDAPKSNNALQFIVVHLTDKVLFEDDYYPPHGITGTCLQYNVFLQEVKRKDLFDKLDIFIDNRPVQINSSCQPYYIYNWNGYNDCYSIAINLDTEQPNTNKIGDNCYSYVISNCASSTPPYPFPRSN